VLQKDSKIKILNSLVVSVTQLFSLIPQIFRKLNRPTLFEILHYTQISLLKVQWWLSSHRIPLDVPTYFGAAILRAALHISSFFPFFFFKKKKKRKRKKRRLQFVPLKLVEN
jgi:hypothetical protein